jgi:aspartyl-tRNA(Asn)/glutamyl-tRNA(Gln) amidotransferase subunit A
MKDDLCFLSIADAGRLMKSRQISPVDLTKALLARIEKVDPKVHAYITVTADIALKEAKQAETEIAAGRYRGPLHGIPYALKDNIDTAGTRTTGNSALLKNNVPAQDATCVAKLRQAGAVLIGKAALREFATGQRHDDLPWPYPLNPFNLAHDYAGGSSTGSAAAVAAGLATCALGTDTGGSVRNPSSLSALAGMKPTYGRISRTGVIANTFSLDSVGPMCRTVEDCALLLGAVSGFDEEDPGSAKEPVPDFTAGIDKGISGLRIGVLRHFFEDDLPADSEMVRTFDAALEVLRSLGARIENAKLRPISDYHACKVLLTLPEFYAVHEKDLKERPELFGPKAGRRGYAGMMVRAVDYIQAQRMHLQLARDARESFKAYDAMVTLTTLESAPLDKPEPRGSAVQQPSLTMPFSVTGLPAMSLPTGFDKNGLPLAMQIAGKAFDEAMIFRVGRAYERATNWTSRRPALTEAA